jgi:hypothetical protein
MAGQGPAPKDLSQRRNRNVPRRGEWVDLAPLEKPVLPELPEGEWRERTRMAWEAWRRDPVSAQWTPSDVDYAIDTIYLHHGMTPNSASEVRLRMDALGLTPKGKRDLRWRTAEPEPERAKGSSSSQSDRRARLTVVQ